MDEICKELLAGTLEMPLNNCQLLQCSTTTPILYRGPGMITQDANGCLHLRMFSEGLDVHEAMRREFCWGSVAGQIIPETEYFDFHGVDQFGAIWTAKHLSLGINFGKGTYIQASPRALEKVISLDHGGTDGSITAIIKGQLRLPWHEATKYGESGYKVDQFKAEGDDLKWSVKEIDDGALINVMSINGSIESRFTEFLHALSILTGRDLRPAIVYFAEDNKFTTRLFSKQEALGNEKLLPPIQAHRSEAIHAHAFLSCFLSYTFARPEGQRHGRVIHQLWHRILRARENDIENSSLVLSVAVESLIKEALASESDIDPEFAEQLKHAKPILKNAGLQPRALQCVLSSLGNALRPRTQDVLQRLIKEQILREAHLEAWRRMRHAAAHGEAIDFDSSALQIHIDRFHTCLDLFYRLIFKLIGFTGNHQDFSTIGWPAQTFPPQGGT